MEIAIVILSITVLGAVILLVFVFNTNTMNTQAIQQMHKEIDTLQEKRIVDFKELLESNRVVTDKLTDAAKMYNDAGKNVADKIQEAIDVMNGNQAGILMKLDRMERSHGAKN